ncbi:carboxylating nicotinate-nucleotide diphosphorylase [candidate division KSB1 bacterium]|nr:carboxylating nicotinate-nucleotide diphosphorylase [candidate division KSB1 bacterium]
MIKNLTEIIQNALIEDLDEHGDVTSMATVDEDVTGTAEIIAKEDGILAGGFVVEKVFNLVDANISVDIKFDDGAAIKNRDVVFVIKGPLRSILTGERTALNLLCRMSGIATLTSRFVKLVAGTGVKVLDTRKTTPGLRSLEKYAVRIGGGFNHRIGLFDMVLIKENHIVAANGISNAVRRSRSYLKQNDLDLKIEVECRTLDEVAEAIELNVDRIMVDNMDIDQIEKAVRFVNGRTKLEISGGVNLDTIAEYAKTGVNYISIGQLTHSARAMDFSLLVKE